MNKKLHDATIDKQIAAYRKQVEADLLKEAEEDVSFTIGSLLAYYCSRQDQKDKKDDKKKSPSKEEQSKSAVDDEENEDLVKFPLGAALFRNDQVSSSIAAHYWLTDSTGDAT